MEIKLKYLYENQSLYYMGDYVILDTADPDAATAILLSRMTDHDGKAILVEGFSSYHFNDADRLFTVRYKYEKNKSKYEKNKSEYQFTICETCVLEIAGKTFLLTEFNP